MRLPFVIGFAVIFLKLIFDIYMGNVEKEKKKIYALLSAFLCEMFFGEILLTDIQRKRLQRVIEDYIGNFKAYYKKWEICLNEKGSFACCS